MSLEACTQTTRLTVLASLGNKTYLYACDGGEGTSNTLFLWNNGA